MKWLQVSFYILYWKRSAERSWLARLLVPSYTDPLANFTRSWRMGETEDVDMAVMYYSIKAW